MMPGPIPNVSFTYAISRVVIVASVAMLVVAGIAQSDQQPGVTKERGKSSPNVPREPKWLPVRDLRVDNFSIEYEFSSEIMKGARHAVEGTRRATVVCLRAVFPQQEQLDEIASAIPALTVPAPERDRRPATDLLTVADFKLERQDLDAHIKQPDWGKSHWVEVSTEALIERLSEALDFDPEIMDMTETNQAFTCPLPKLAKGRWDARVLHPGLSENKLSEKQGTDGKPLHDRKPVGGVRFALFRYFDFDVKPDRAYRYRVKLVSENPGYGKESLPREIAEGEFRESPWSDPSSPVVVRTEAK